MAWIRQRHSEVVAHGPEKATWIVGWRDPSNNRQQTKSFGRGKKGLKAAERYKATLEMEIESGKYTRVPTNYSWEAFRKRYEDNVGSLMRPKTQAEIRLAFDAFERLIGPRYLRAIRTETIDRFKALRSNEGVAIPTVNKALRVLKAALRKAEEWELIGKAPRIKLLKEDEHDRGYCPEDSFVRLYNAADAASKPSVSNVAPGDWWRAILIFAWSTGWRINQILSIRWDHVDLQGGAVRSPAELNKGRRDVRIPLEPIVMDHLRRIEGGKLAGNQLVFPFPGGYCETYDVLDELIKVGQVPPKEDGSPIRWHDFRRSFATYNEANLSRFELKVLMQHASLQTTDRYVSYARKANMSAGKVHVPSSIVGQVVGQAPQLQSVVSP